MIKSVLVFIINLATGKWERMFLFNTEKYKSNCLFHFIFRDFLLNNRKHKYG